MDLDGSVAVVTGAAAGIGRATALAFARAGSDVVLADLDLEGAEGAAAGVEAAGRRALILRTDVTRRDEIDALVDRAIGWQGRCDVFMSNVGVGCVGAPHEFSPDEWAYLLDVNLLSCIWPLRAVIPHMTGRGRGTLVFVASGAGYEGQADRAPYNVAKFGIVGLAESCARALIGSGVGVTLAVPGAIASDGWRRLLVAGDRDPAEVARVRAEQRDATASWPAPETMAAAIVDGVRADRFLVLQHNPYEPGWFEDLLVRKARDPEGFISG